MAKLQGKVAIVTGSARGIGRAIAERLGQDGAHVIINYLGNQAKAEEAVATIRARGGQATAIQGDMGVIANINRLFEKTLADLGRIDIVVANAGQAGFGPIAEFSEADFDQIFAVNAKGTFFCLQQAARHVAEGGSIVAISSVLTKMPTSPLSAYSATKAAVEQFVRVLAHELAPRGVSVNAVSPGYTATDMLASAGEEFTQFGASLSPYRRIGQPSEIATVVSSLVDPDARWVTGQNIVAGGGIFMS